MPLPPLVIVGAGGMGREVAWLVNDINSVSPTWDLLGFIDASPELQGQTVGGYPVLGGREWLERRRGLGVKATASSSLASPSSSSLVSSSSSSLASSSPTSIANENAPPNSNSNSDNLHVVIAIGTSATRHRVVRDLEPLNLRYVTLVHPSVRMEKRAPMAARIGMGTIVCANSVLTVDVWIGDHVIVSAACTVSHDAVVNDFATLLPAVNVSGFSAVGDGAIVGTGSQILECRSVGARTIVGAGSVVVKDLPSDCTAVGAPARPIKIHENRDQKNAFKERKS